MKKKDEFPVCKEGDLIMDQLVELTSKGCGGVYLQTLCWRNVQQVRGRMVYTVL